MAVHIDSCALLVAAASLILSSRQLIALIGFGLLRVPGTGRNEAPPQQIERPLADLMVLANDKRSAAVTRRHIRKPVVGHVEPIDQPVADGPEA